jgi:hypothetical protein
VEIKLLGIKLGGSAAIGAAFIILVHSYFPPRDYAIITLPEEHRDKNFYPRSNDSVRCTRISTGRYLVEFTGNESNAKFIAKQLDPTGSAFNIYEFTVNRNGIIKNIDYKERLR